MSEGKNKKMNVKQISERLNKENVKKGFEYIRRNGVSRFWTLAKAKAFPAGKSYKEWYEEHCPTKEELMRQREVEFSVQPLISIVVPTYQTPIPFLKDMIDSVRKQSYEKWELCIADGSLNGDENDTKVIRVREELNRYSMEDKRIKVVYLEENQGIAENTNQALALATGEDIGLFDHDDMIMMCCTQMRTKSQKIVTIIKSQCLNRITARNCYALIIISLTFLWLKNQL